MKYEDVLQEIVDSGKEEAAEQWLKNVETDYGNIPLIFEKMSTHPEVLISHLLYKNAITATSSLEPKIVELISLAVGAALQCDHCLEYHKKSALRMGATKEEILEAVLIAGSLAQATVLASAYRVIDKNGDSCEAGCDIGSVYLRKKEEHP